MTDIKVHGLLVVDGDVDNGTPGTANMGQAYDDLKEMEAENDRIGGTLVEAWAATDHQEQVNEIVASILDIVRDQRDEARGIATTLYLVLEAALVAFNAEPYGEEEYQKQAREALWAVLETSPEWVQKMDHS